MFGPGGRFRRDPLHLRRPRFEPPTINRLIPNVLTVLALCAGFTALRFAMMERWDLAIFAVMVAAVLDVLDGRLARLLNGTSKFGAELDSLSDFLCFGAVPAMMVYLATLHHLGGLGWAFCLVFAVCCALRLARFNTMIGDPEPPPWAGAFFVGVPAPAGAFLALLPMMGTIQFGGGFFDRPSLNAVVMLAVAALMVSRIPTFSTKKIKLTPSMALPILLLAVISAAALASEPFLTFLIAGALYIASIPVSVWSQARARRALAEEPLPAPALPAGQGEMPAANRTDSTSANQP
jgi:CDP-diacylglycerol--serine O-phosphatidyltransferase